MNALKLRERKREEREREREREYRIDSKLTALARHRQLMAGQHYLPDGKEA